MEILNLKTLSKNIAATKFKQSSKIIIRDVDEESKNRFVAYADDKSESYDVSIEIDDNDDVIENNCDCEIKGLCLHRIAFMVHLSTRKAKPKVVRVKKQTATEILVNNLDVNVLRIWMNDFLKKNKDIEFLFVSEFAVNSEDYTKPKVKLLIDNSIKSVIKNRKNIETNELKKIVDLLEVTLKPVFEFCSNDLTNKDNLEIIIFVFDELKAFDFKIYSSSVKIIRFIEKLSKQVIDSFSKNNDDIKWQKITDLHFELIFNAKLQTLNNHNFDHVKLLYNSNLDNEFRKKYFAKKTETFATALFAQKMNYDVSVNYFLLNVIYDNDLFHDNYMIFKDFRYENDYNLSLIDKLIAINKIDNAEKMALSQIASNYYVDYNLPYWQRLKSIYQNQNQVKKLIDILLDTVPLEMNFDDYLLVKKALPEADFKKYRSNLLAKVKRIFHSGHHAPTFYFKLLAEENNFKKMIEVICEHTDYDLVYEYRNELVKVDKVLFLKQVAMIQSNDYFRRKTYNEEYRNKIIDWFIDNYEQARLNSFIVTYQNRTTSQFLELLQEKLNKSI